MPAFCKFGWLFDTKGVETKYKAMPKPRDKQEFLRKINNCSGIIQKVSRLFADSKQDREDLQQEILLQSWKSYPQFKGDAKFSTWLYQLSLNTALVFQRKLKKHSTDSLPACADANGHQDETCHDEKALLLTALKSLTKVERMMITLYFEGYGYSEIAGMMGITKENSAVRIHRIKKSISQKLKQI